MAAKLPFVISTHSWHYRIMRLAVRVADRAGRALGDRHIKKEFEFGDDLTLCSYIGSVAYAISLAAFLVTFATGVYLGGALAAAIIIIVPAASLVSVLAQYPLIPWSIVTAFWVVMGIAIPLFSVTWWLDTHPRTPRRAVITC